MKRDQVRPAQRPIHDIAERWGRLNASALLAGRQPAFSDHLLVATALSRGLVLVTRNVKDFVWIDVALKNPWE